MKYVMQTRIFIGVVIAAIIIFDVYVMVAGGSEATISHELIAWSYQYPVLPFVIGFTMGHLFWRISKVNGKAKRD